MLFASHLAPFCTAFCTKMACVLHQNGLRLAPKCTAFSTKTPCVWQQNALYLAKNSPKHGTDCSFMQRIFVSLAFTTTLFWHQNKPSRELDFCGRADECWPKMALIMLKFMLKNGQKRLADRLVVAFASWFVNKRTTSQVNKLAN